MKTKNTILSLSLIIFLFIILKLIVGKTYVPIYPGIPIYPDNNKEVETVKKIIKKRTFQDINFFHETNYSVSSVFSKIVDETKDDLDNIIKSVGSEILFFKYLINRARPQAIDKTIKPISTLTSQTPAYPAGHAYQAYFLAKKLSKKYPNKKDILDKLAYECDLTRVKAGIHYPSDGAFSKFLVDNLYK